MEFRWNGWNTDHIGEHNVTRAEAEHVVEHPAPGFPRYQGDGRYQVHGQAASGEFIQVIYIFSPPGVVYVIHARLLTQNEKRNLKRRRRR